MRSTTAEYQRGASPLAASICRNLALTRSPTAKGPALGGNFMGATKDRAARAARPSARAAGSIVGTYSLLSLSYLVGSGRSSARMTRQLRSLSGNICLAALVARAASGRLACALWHGAPAAQESSTKAARQRSGQLSTAEVLPPSLGQQARAKIDTRPQALLASGM